MSEHDPICPWISQAFLPDGTIQTVSCQCDLIYRVRKSMNLEWKELNEI